MKITALVNTNQFIELSGEQVHWKQLSVMIGYERSIPEDSWSRSQAMKGQGSPLCEIHIQLQKN